VGRGGEGEGGPRPSPAPVATVTRGGFWLSRFGLQLCNLDDFVRRV